jgi:acetoin utilization deacetylase AcuC-like enzyme
MDKEHNSRRLPYRLIYHEGYDLNFGAHVFPSRKYRLIRDRLLCTGLAKPADFVRPEPAPESDLLLVHEPDWVSKLTTGTLSFQEIRQLEVPYSRQMVNGFLLSAGGTTLAAECALEDGAGYNVGGGFHHAFAGHGEGFCAVNDIAVAIRSLRSRGRIEKAMVVDCDVHHGNGTAAIFATDAHVFTLSIHQYHNYPAEKPPSTVDIHLPDGVGDDEYLKRLMDALETAIAGFRPELIVYVAGADPYCEDQLGGLSLTLEGLKARDELVFETALRHRVPVAATLAGGYARNTEDTVTIHVQTALAARDCLAGTGWKGPKATTAER